MIVQASDTFAEEALLAFRTGVFFPGRPVGGADHYAVAGTSFISRIAVAGEAGAPIALLTLFTDHQLVPSAARGIALHHRIVFAFPLSRRAQAGSALSLGANLILWAVGHIPA